MGLGNSGDNANNCSNNQQSGKKSQDQLLLFLGDGNVFGSGFKFCGQEFLQVCHFNLLVGKSTGG